MLGGVLPKWKKKGKNSKFPYYAVVKSASVMLKSCLVCFLHLKVNIFYEELKEHLLTGPSMKYLLYIVFAHFSLVYNFCMLFFPSLYYNFTSFFIRIINEIG